MGAGVSLAPREADAKRRRRTLRDERLRPDRRAVDERESKPLRARGHDQLRLDHGELVPETAARPAAKRDIGELLAGRLAFRREPFRIEPLRIGPQRRPSMDDERDDEDKPAPAHGIAADRVLVDRAAGEPPRGWRSEERR